MAKGMMIIDGQRVSFDGEKNVLSVIRKAGIEMPTFCYYSDLSVYGACRMCVVEDDRGRIDASCSMEPRDGLSIQTNTARLLKYRRMIIELLLASHDRDCTVCEKSSACELRRLALRFGVRRVRFEDTREQLPLDTSSPSVVRDPNKCIPCREGTKRMLEALERIVGNEGSEEDIELLEELSDTISHTALCGLGQSACKPVQSTLRYFREDYERHVRDKFCPLCNGKPKVLQIDPEKCKGCSLCARNCPVEAITGEVKSPFVIDTEKCIRCNACVKNCKFGAIREV